MMVRSLLALAGTATWLLACGGSQESAPGPQETPSVGGVWEVTGLTTEKGTGAQRRIQGTIVITQTGADWTSSFNLTTSYPTPDGSLDADVIGSGSGAIEGGRMVGIAETQLVLSTVPGVDTGFAFIPRQVGPRLISNSTAKLTDDGALEIEIENRPDVGQQYAETLTRVRGVRVLEQGAPGFPPVPSRVSAGGASGPDESP